MQLWCLQWHLQVGVFFCVMHINIDWIIFLECSLVPNGQAICCEYFDFCEMFCQLLFALEIYL